MVVAMCCGGQTIKLTGGHERFMREIADNFIKLIGLIMLTLTLAVSTAAFTMLFG